MPEDAIGPVFWACLGIDAGADDMGAEG
jgi:hypothetical protein